MFGIKVTIELHTSLLPNNMKNNINDENDWINIVENKYAIKNGNDSVSENNNILEYKFEQKKTTDGLKRK